MTTVTLAPHWPAISDRIATLFRFASPADVAAIGPDAPRLVDYLARTHDLTAAECAEVLDLRLRVDPPASLAA